MPNGTDPATRYALAADHVSSAITNVQKAGNEKESAYLIPILKSIHTQILRAFHRAVDENMKRFPH